MTKTDQALQLVEQGMTAYAAAKQVGITPTTVYVAMQRRKGKVPCPCCGTVVPADQINHKALRGENPRRHEINVGLARRGSEQFGITDPIELHKKTGIPLDACIEGIKQ